MVLSALFRRVVKFLSSSTFNTNAVDLMLLYLLCVQVEDNLPPYFLCSDASSYALVFFVHNYLFCKYRYKDRYVIKIL